LTLKGVLYADTVFTLQMSLPGLRSRSKYRIAKVTPVLALVASMLLSVTIVSPSPYDQVKAADVELKAALESQISTMASLNGELVKRPELPQELKRNLSEQ